MPQSKPLLWMTMVTIMTTMTLFMSTKTFFSVNNKPIKTKNMKSTQQTMMKW